MVNSEVAISPGPARVLFARIGSMTHYAGPQPGDERPKGGGRYNKEHTGHEVFNFADFGGHLYGTVRAKRGHVNLARIDPNAAGAKKLDDVLIVFVARQHVVGWYQKATVYADTNPNLPPSVAKEMRRRLDQSKVKGFEVGGYRFEAKAKGAKLLPKYERTHEIPSNKKGAFGQSNICYPYQTNGRSKKSAWINKAIQYVLSYDKANLLINPEDEGNTNEAATVAQERAAGFQSDPQIRGLIEQYAMREAQKELEKRGFCMFQNTSATKPYDFICDRDGRKFYVEVKGTQTTGKTILLTKNEVEHVKANGSSCILVVVHSVMVSGKQVAKNGIPDVTEKWDLTEGELTATHYLWKH